MWYNKIESSDFMLGYINKLNKENKLDCSFSTLICYYIFIFFVGAVAGFIYEEIFYFVVDGILVKSGFLYGFYLPVYGIGAVLMVLFLKRFKNNPLIVFVLAMVVTGVLEYITGVLLWELYNRTWWDYDGLFLNIDGYVCLRSVLSFAVGGIFLIYFIEPLIVKFVNKFKKDRLIIYSYVIIFVFVIDLVFTLIFRNTL